MLYNGAATFIRVFDIPRARKYMCNKDGVMHNAQRKDWKMYNSALALYTMIKYTLEIHKWNVSENAGIYLKEIVLTHIHPFDPNHSVNRWQYQNFIKFRCCNCETHMQCFALYTFLKSNLLLTLLF